MAVVLRSQIEFRLWADFVFERSEGSRLSRRSPTSARAGGRKRVDLKRTGDEEDRSPTIGK